MTTKSKSTPALTTPEDVLKAGLKAEYNALPAAHPPDMLNNPPAGDKQEIVTHLVAAILNKSGYHTMLISAEERAHIIKGCYDIASDIINYKD